MKNQIVMSCLGILWHKLFGDHEDLYCVIAKTHNGLYHGSSQFDQLILGVKSEYYV